MGEFTARSMERVVDVFDQRMKAVDKRLIHEA